MISLLRSDTGTLVWSAQARVAAARASVLPNSACSPPCRAITRSSERNALPLPARANRSVAARSPNQCPVGRRVWRPRSAGACPFCPDSQSSSSPTATPMQALTVAVEPSGDSGCTWSRTLAALTLSPSAMAVTPDRSAATARSRAGPTGALQRYRIDQRALATLDPELVEAAQHGVAVPHGAGLIPIAEVALARDPIDGASRGRRHRPRHRTQLGGLPQPQHEVRHL